MQDVNRQTIAGSTALLVHPSALYVGVRTPRSFVRRGDSFKIETITTDLDGKAMCRPQSQNRSDFERLAARRRLLENVEVDRQTCEITSTETVAACDLTAKEGGVYSITATVFDDRERPNESEIQLWVEGAQTEPKRGIEKENVMLIPDKKEYAPDETAEILVSSPFVPAEGVLTLRRNGIVKTERFTMNESSTVLQIPIEERYLPNIHAQVDLVGAAERTNDKNEVDKTLPKRPAFASGELNLKVSTASRQLIVAAEPIEKILEPGAQTRKSMSRSKTIRASRSPMRKSRSSRLTKAFWLCRITASKIRSTNFTPMSTPEFSTITHAVMSFWEIRTTRQFRQKKSKTFQLTVGNLML